MVLSCSRGHHPRATTAADIWVASLVVPLFYGIYMATVQVDSQGLFWPHCIASFSYLGHCKPGYLGNMMGSNMRNPDSNPHSAQQKSFPCNQGWDPRTARKGQIAIATVLQRRKSGADKGSSIAHLMQEGALRMCDLWILFWFS